MTTTTTTLGTIATEEFEGNRSLTLRKLVREAAERRGLVPNRATVREEGPLENTGHEIRKADASPSALPGECVCGYASCSLPCVHTTPTGPRCQAPYDLNELRHAAYDRLAEGDRDAYLWAMDWIELCQSAHGGRAVVYER